MTFPTKSEQKEKEKKPTKKNYKETFMEHAN